MTSSLKPRTRHWTSEIISFSIFASPSCEQLWEATLVRRKALFCHSHLMRSLVINSYYLQQVLNQPRHLPYLLVSLGLHLECADPFFLEIQHDSHLSHQVCTVAEWYVGPSHMVTPLAHTSSSLSPCNFWCCPFPPSPSRLLVTVCSIKHPIRRIHQDPLLLLRRKYHMDNPRYTRHRSCVFISTSYYSLIDGLFPHFAFLSLAWQLPLHPWDRCDVQVLGYTECAHLCIMLSA